tara:strand:- start:348 stop:473 length:126 start_codon:yes stop_codon:yes gene_type:complete
MINQKSELFQNICMVIGSPIDAAILLGAEENTISNVILVNK